MGAYGLFLSRKNGMQVLTGVLTGSMALQIDVPDVTVHLFCSGDGSMM